VSPLKHGRDPPLPWPLARGDHEHLPRLVPHTTHPGSLHAGGQTGWHCKVWICSWEPQQAREQLRSSEHVFIAVDHKSNLSYTGAKHKGSTHHSEPESGTAVVSLK